jgi:3-dehydroquinate synthetase
MHAIVTSVQAKARVVAQDERETGARALLNLGHTFGHALEAETGYSDRLLHGESVSIGMVLAFQLSERLGLCVPQTARRISGFLQGVGLPTSPRDIAHLQTTPDTLIEHMTHDKKAKNGRLTLILARGIGDAFVTQDVPLSVIRDTLSDALS